MTKDVAYRQKLAPPIILCQWWRLSECWLTHRHKCTLHRTFCFLYDCTGLVLFWIPWISKNISQMFWVPPPLNKYFAKFSSPYFWIHMHFLRKYDPCVSDSFTLNSSRWCFVRAVWCPISFFNLFISHLSPFLLNRKVTNKFKPRSFMWNS